MKKIVITAVAVVTAAVAAQAQVPNVEVRIADAGFRGLLPNSKLSAQKTSLDTLQNAVERQVAKEQAKATKNKKETTAAQTPAAATTPAPVKSSKQAVASANDESGIFAWIKALVLGGPMPGESAETYRLRLEAQRFPAAQPYK